MVGERLGLGVIHAAGWSAIDIQDVAREAEAAGIDANIYLRHAYVCAQGAALIAEVTGGLVLAWLRLFGSFVSPGGASSGWPPC
jgi:hypothetical protein